MPINSLEHSIWSGDHGTFLTLHDLNTGLPNRILFLDRLEHSIALSKRYSSNPIVMLIHMEGLDEVGKVHGEKVLNLLSKEFARRLLQFKRESDTLAFLGSEDFGFIFENVPSKTVITSIAARIYSSVSTHYTFEEREIHLTPSISVCDDLLMSFNQPIRFNNDVVEELFIQRKLVNNLGEFSNGLE